MKRTSCSHLSRATSFTLALALAWTALCCEERRPASNRPLGSSEPSPNASILPAPLATGIEGRDDAGRGARDAGLHALDAGSDAGPPDPRALRQDRALGADNPQVTTGLSLNARFRWLDLPPPVRVPELNSDATQRAREDAGLLLSIDLGGTRMRVAIASRTFTLALGSELRGRDDLYGYTVLWPDRSAYTVLAPGTLRAVFAEQRADVVPLVRPKLTPLAGGNLLGLASERVELATPTGKLELEQGHLSGPAPSGATLCRLLLEFLAVQASSSACRSDLLPLRAEYLWPNGGRFSFEVTRITRRSDLDPALLAVPAFGAEFRPGELPGSPSNVLFGADQLADLHVRGAARSERLDPAAPKLGLLAVNHSESLRYVLVDGVPVVWLRPGSEQLVLGPRAGKYGLQARDFFGGDAPASKTLELPARFAVGDDLERAR